MTTRFIYNHSPWLFQTLIASYYGIYKSFQKFGDSYQRCFEHINKSQWFSAAQINELQLRELKNVIGYVYQNVPYYSELFKRLNLVPADFQSIDDLKKLPVLTKEDVRANFERLTPGNLSPKDVITEHTSGSTGKAMKFLLSKDCYQKEYAFLRLQRTWAGVEDDDRVATFGGHAVIKIDRHKPPFWINNYFEHQVLFSSYHMSERNLGFYAEKLIRFNPDLILGYPSSIYLMASYLSRRNITVVKPKAVITSSESLLDFQRKLIEQVFRTKVYSYYGNAERVSNISQCERGGLHIKPEYGIIEFLDENDEPVEEGEPGRMVCTGFLNDAMPLIRYDVGDIAIPIQSECACGRSGPLVKEIVGRTDDFIVTPNGEHIGRLSQVFKGIDAVEEAQFVQNEKERVIINVVKRADFSEHDSKAIIYNAKDRLGDDIGIELRFVPNIRRHANGKFKFVISNVAREI